jgi:hypothetical protein
LSLRTVSVINTTNLRLGPMVRQRQSQSSFNCCRSSVFGGQNTPSTMKLRGCAS